MLIVLETHSVAWAESMRLTLLANGIEAVVLDQHSPGIMRGSRLAIVNDSDLHRAAKLVADLRPPKTEPLPSWWWHKRALVLLGAGFVLVYAATLLAESASIRPLAPLLTIAGAVAFVVGFTLLFLGYRADGRRNDEQSEISGVTPVRQPADDR